jgi:hypothetical protein
MNTGQMATGFSTRFLPDLPDSPGFIPMSF